MIKFTPGLNLGYIEYQCPDCSNCGRTGAYSENDHKFFHCEHCQTQLELLEGTLYISRTQSGYYK